MQGPASESVGVVEFMGSDPRPHLAANPSGVFLLKDVQPHIRLRLKSVFPKISKGQFDVLTMQASPENARDLEWFMTRYPLECRCQDEISTLARQHDERVHLTHGLLEGDYAPPLFSDMRLPPRDYQRVAAALALVNRGLLCADELGLGKTITALTALMDPDTLPCLIVVPTHLQIQWSEKVQEFTHLEPHIIKVGSPYPLIGLEGYPDVLISTYHKLRGWADVLAGKVKGVVFDECQELRRMDSQKYRAADHIAANAEFRMGLSATPIYNYGAEFWAVINVLSPNTLGSRHEFLREWCTNGYRGKERIKNPKAFGMYLKEAGLMVRRTREDVGRELPSLSRVVDEIPSDPQPLMDAKDRASELARIILGQGTGFDKLKASQDLSSQLRQATGLAKAPYVAEFVNLLLEDSPDPVIVFGWHRAVYDIWMEQLQHWNPLMYTGSESPQKKADAIQALINGDSNVLLMSLRSGSGVDGLQEVCSRVVIGELDWSPGALEQCIGRVHRDGQDKPVFAYYLTAADGADPVMIDTLGLKKQQIDGVREPHGKVTIPKEVDPDHIKKLARAHLARSGR